MSPLLHSTMGKQCLLYYTVLWESNVCCIACDIYLLSIANIYVTVATHFKRVATLTYLLKTSNLSD